jgi:hypothetical protein
VPGVARDDLDEADLLAVSSLADPDKGVPQLGGRSVPQHHLIGHVALARVTKVIWATVNWRTC